MAAEHGSIIGRVRLFGFLRGVDWRPTQLRDPLARSLVCSLCGVVPRRTASLPCSHVLCESCLEGSMEGAVDGRCLLDERHFLPAQIVWNAIRPEDVITAKVRCWNAASGCDYAGPVRGLLDHFEKDCAFHVAMCPRCHVMQTRTQLPAHYRAGCVPEFSPERRHQHGPHAAESDAARSDPSSLRAASNCTSQDTLAVLETRMNELLEYVRALGTRSALMDAEMSDAKDLLTSLVLSAGDERGAASSGGNEDSALHADGDMTTERRDGRTSLRSIPRLLGRFSAAIRRARERRNERREQCSFLVAFKKTGAEHDTEGTLSAPLDPETWAARTQAPDGTCVVKIFLLEEMSTLHVYAAADQTTESLNPWTLASVSPARSWIRGGCRFFTLRHQGTMNPMRAETSASSNVIAPTWTVSRQSRDSLSDEGYGHCGSYDYGEMCRMGFVDGDQTMLFCVRLTRKWGVPRETS